MLTGEIIKILRINSGLTQEELAIKLGVKKNSIQKYEASVVPNLKMDTIRKLCELFSVSPCVFVFPEKIKDCGQVMKYKIENHYHELFINLNDEGIQKVLTYIRDLHDSTNYASKSQD